MTLRASLPLSFYLLYNGIPHISIYIRKLQLTSNLNNPYLKRGGGRTPKMYQKLLQITHTTYA